jgi:hypothetical protein
MMKDEILEQVWLAKDAVAKKYGHDVQAMAKALRKREKTSKAPVVNLHDRHAECVAEEPGEYKTKLAGGAQRRAEG